jgi:RES domain-containing protein
VYVWRLTQQKHQETAFSGEGGLYASGRWSPKGLRVVYTASSLALATLELFVHLESDRIPLVAIRAEIPDNLPIESVNIDNLPKNWQEATAYPQLQPLGKQWLQNRSTAILQIPSAIVPVESNYLINPEHPDCLKIQLDPPVVYKLDHRLWKSA